MKLMPKSIAAKVPSLDATAELSSAEQFAYVKFFNPCGGQTWWISAYDPETREAFGFVNLGDPQCAELGYISIDELEALKLPFGLGIERDLSFKKTPLDEIMNQVKRG